MRNDDSHVSELKLLRPHDQAKGWMQWMHGEDVFASLKVYKTQNISLLSPFEWSKMVQVFIFSLIRKRKRQKTHSVQLKQIINT